METKCIPVVEVIAFLVLGQNWIFFKGLLKRNGEEGKKDGCAPSFFFSLNTCYLPGSAATQTAFLIAASFRI